MQAICEQGMGMNVDSIFQRIKDEIEKRQFEISFAAPFFFFFVALFRCYLESNVFAARHYFSYFVALHHVLWYFTVILFMILVTHLILKVAVEKLLWLMYGAALLMMPIIVVMIQGRPMTADYLSGSFQEIAVHIFTIYFTYEKNLPLTAEVIVIFIGMTTVGYIYSKSLLRGLALGAAIYFGGNLLAINWLGTTLLRQKAVITVQSALLTQPFMAVVCAHCVTFFTAIIAYRAGLIKGNAHYLSLSAAISVSAGIVYMAIVGLSGWFANPLDIFLTALPFWTTAFLAALYTYRQQIPLCRWFWAVSLTVILFQWAVLGPICFHAGVVKPLTTQEFWMLPVRPY